MGLVNFGCIDTSPGAGGPFGPPPDWEGDEQAYRLLMLDRRSNMEHRQQIVAIGRRAHLDGVGKFQFLGPHAEQAKQFVQTTARWLYPPERE